MSPEAKKEYYSTLKWLLLIIVSAMTVVTIIPKVYPQYYFLHNGKTRGNTLTGKIERYDEGEWVDVTESERARDFRLERKRIKAKEYAEFKKKYAAYKDDDLDFLPYEEYEEDDSAKRSYL